MQDATICVGIRLLRRLVGDGLRRNSKELVSTTGDQVAEGVGSAAFAACIVAKLVGSLAFK